MVSAPTKKAKLSQNAAVLMLGPTSWSPWPIFSERLCVGAYFTAFEIMNMLSTPIAKIKNGMTSALISESPMFMRLMTPDG